MKADGPLSSYISSWPRGSMEKSRRDGSSQALRHHISPEHIHTDGQVQASVTVSARHTSLCRSATSWFMPPPKHFLDTDFCGYLDFVSGNLFSLSYSLQRDWNLLFGSRLDLMLPNRIRNLCFQCVASESLKLICIKWTSHSDLNTFCHLLHLFKLSVPPLWHAHTDDIFVYICRQIPRRVQMEKDRRCLFIVLQLIVPLYELWSQSVTRMFYYVSYQRKKYVYASCVAHWRVRCLRCRRRRSI